MKISPMIRFCSPDTKGPNRKDKVYYIVFDTEEEAQEIINLLEMLRLESRNKATKIIQNACEHEWVSAVNEVIKSGEFCLKCHAIRA